jgi:hypothetical protein
MFGWIRVYIIPTPAWALRARLHSRQNWDALLTVNVDRISHNNILSNDS